MKIKEILAVAIVSLAFLIITGAAKAGEYQDKQKVTSYVTHYYKTVEVQNRQFNRVCKDVDVPIYGNSNQGLSGEQVIGAIIGGVIGSKIGKGDGNKIATGVGAVIGSQVGKNNTQQNIVGYKRTRVCEDNPTYTTEYKKVYSHSIIRFTDKENRVYDIQFVKHQ